MSPLPPFVFSIPEKTGYVSSDPPGEISGSQINWRIGNKPAQSE